MGLRGSRFVVFLKVPFVRDDIWRDPVFLPPNQLRCTDQEGQELVVIQTPNPCGAACRRAV